MPVTKRTPHFNLDDFEREDTPEPFVVELGHKTYVLADVQELDFRELSIIVGAARNGDMVESVRLLVAEKDRPSFLANKIPSWKINELFDRYSKHYGLTPPGEAPAS